MHKRTKNQQKHDKKTQLGHASLKGWSLIFYGTRHLIDKNDPVSVPLIPLNTANAQNINNQVVAVSKPSGGKGNRKQQQSQKPASSSPSSSSSNASRKNGKQNGKNQNGGGGKNWKQRPSTARPSTVSNKERKYEFINGILVVNKASATTTTTTRPIKLSNNNVDSKDGEKLIYVKAPIKAPKQIKEILNSAYTNATANDDSVNTKNMAGLISNGGGSSSKSVAAKTTASPFDAHIELVDSFQYTSNPNIPKLFQRYEKIQEFYPEFHPYVGLPKASSQIGAASSSTATGGKPSRDGSKNSHFLSTANQESAPLPIGMLANTSKKSSARTQSSTVVASKNGKG